MQFLFVSLLNFQSQIEEMSDDEYERHKDALAAQKLEKPKRLSTLFNKFLNEISLQQYHFDRPEKEVVILKTITKQQIIDFYKNYILSTGPKRQALSIHIMSTAEGGIANSNSIEDLPPLDYENRKANNTLLIDDLATFKSSKELYPMVQPYIDIKPKGAKSKL